MRKKKNFTDTDDAIQNALGLLAKLGHHYIDEYVIGKGWSNRRLKRDWYYAFKYCLSYTYYQGRSESLSKRYCDAMQVFLDKYFGTHPEAVLRRLWNQNGIPHDASWTDFAKSKSRLWGEFNSSMGKGRDLEMVLDILRYVYKLPNHNIVAHSVDEIKSGRIRNQRDDLRTIWSVGPKISAFYLRDVVFLFDCKIDANDISAIFPVDTWVSQVVKRLRQHVGDTSKQSEADWFLEKASARYDAGILNAGAWYLGAHSFDLYLESLFPE